MAACPGIDPPPARSGALTGPVVRRGLASAGVPAEWRLSAFVGRLAEISGGPARASLTLIFRLVLEAQRRGEPVAWITRREFAFFPPDVADAGVDLQALVVVWASETRLAVRAAGHLLRSGAFGLVTLDLGTDERIALAAQVVLVGLAKKHGTALLCVTERDGDRSSLGSLVSLRADAVRTQRSGEGFRCEARILKDKRRGPGWTHAEQFHGPDGLR